MKLFSLFALLIVASTPVSSGIPAEKEMSCPIGGETFTITTTLSCGDEGRTISFRPVTTCDFVTRLPVCPSNGLPIYKGFSPNELERITLFLETDNYQELLKISPFLRAYQLEKSLTEQRTSESFGLILHAMWWESETFYISESTVASFAQEAEAEFSRAPQQDQAILAGITAYVLAVAGNTEEARIWLEKANAAIAPNDYIAHYLATIRNCFSKMASNECQPEAMFEPRF